MRITGILLVVVFVISLSCKINHEEIRLLPELKSSNEVKMDDDTIVFELFISCELIYNIYVKNGLISDEKIMFYVNRYHNKRTCDLCYNKFKFSRIAYNIPALNVVRTEYECSSLCSSIIKVYIYPYEINRAFIRVGSVDNGHSTYDTETVLRLLN